MRKHSVLHWLLVLAWTLLGVSATASGNVLPLSAEQRAWMLAHPTVTLGVYDNQWLPFEAVKGGQPQGLAYDTLQEAVHRLGLRLQVRTYPTWGEVLGAACRGEIDLVMDVALTAERTRCMVFTRQYAEAPVGLVTRVQDSRAQRVQDLTGLRVVTEQDFALSTVVRERYPRASHQLAESTLAALRRVADGQADVYLGNAYVAAALLSTEDIAGVGLLRPSDLPLDSLHYGVPNSKQLLAEALDIALSATPEAQRRATRARWLPPLHWHGSGTLAYTAAEQAALKQPLTLGFAPSWAPISFLDNEGQPSGVAGEYLSRFRSAGATGLRIVPFDSWKAIRSGMDSGQLQAVIGVPIDSTMLGEGWVFSQPFLTVSNVIVVGDGADQVLDMRDLDGRRVALSDPIRLTPLLRAQAPDANVVPVATALAGLEDVRAGKAYAYIGNLAVVDRYLQARFSGELHVAAPAGVDDHLALAVRKPYAALAAAFDRMLLSMTVRERESIRNDWLAVEYRSGLDLRSFLKWAVPVALILLAIGLVHAIGHVRLLREVAQRRQVERRLEEVTSNLPAVVYQAHRSSSGVFTLPYIAGDVHSLFGIEAELAVNNERELFARVHPDDQPRLEAELERAAAQFDIIDIDFRARSQMGWVWVRSRGQPHRAEDGAIQWSGYWIDVTEARAQAEALVAARASAEQAAHAKANFLATMSHEIRTPMSGVLGMLEMLSHTRLDREQRRVLSTIEDSAQMLRQILDDILDFSKIEAGALALESTPVNLRKIVDNTLQMFSAQAGAKGVPLSSTIDPDAATYHAADGIRLRQILFNLLSNAIKFTSYGGITVKLHVLDDLDGRQKIQMAVQDTGIGIAPEQQERLFSPFVQAEASTTRKYGGTGLGLTICRRLAGLMEGELQLKSEVGVGTEVSLIVWLPVTSSDDDREQAEDGGSTASMPTSWNNRWILIVEDHATNQELMRWRMRQLGLAHELVSDGEEALKAMETRRFDVVITDIRMPGMDGYTLARTIRERERSNPNSRRMPIIALTANALDEDAQRCREAGMDDFLTKPVPLATLRGALLRSLDGADAVATEQERAGNAAQVEQTAAPSVGNPDRETPIRLPTQAELTSQFGSSEMARKLMESLYAATEADIEALSDAAATQDSHLCSERLHHIAGGLGAIGAGSLAGELRELQHAVDRDGVAAHQSRLDDLVQRLTEGLRLWLS